MTLAEEFYRLFAGSDIGHGSFDAKGSRGDGKLKGVVNVLRSPATVALWEDHLNGGLGLGIIPITSQNQCRWGAIDVDSYEGLDHGALIKRIRKAKVPLVVCRSKSGGAHIYLFMMDFVSASWMRQKMAGIAAFLGYAGSEIFPKQDEILESRGDTGNFLNSPYHNDTKSMRYGFDDNGNALTAAEFIPYAKQFITTEKDLDKVKLEIKTEHFPEGPPCLQHLAVNGFTPGSRNNALFSIGVYARQRFDTEWEAKVHEYNNQYMSPPLEKREVDAIIKQLQRKDYYYRCNDQPIVAFCNKALCRTRKFGVGNTGGGYTMADLTKIDGDPALWILTLEGRRVELGTKGLVNQNEFILKSVEQANMYPRTVSQPIWETRVQELLSNVTVVQVTGDSTVQGEFEQLLNAFALERSHGTEREDVNQGISVWEGEDVYFQIRDLRRFLKLNDFRHYTNNKLTLTLEGLGAKQAAWPLRAKTVQVWSLPRSFFQLEEKEVPLPPLPNREEVM